MEFTEAIEIIKNIVPESSANEYDGIIVKRLEASNTLDEGRTTNQTHIAISGEQMNMFPYLMADGYFKCDYNDRDEQLKKYKSQIEIHLGLEAEFFPHHMQELMDLNDLASGTINPGQELKVPANSRNDQDSSSADSSSQGDSDN